MVPALIAASALYLAGIVELVAAVRKDHDRRPLLSSVVTMLFALALARAVLPAQPVGIWPWVLGVALFGAALGLAIVRWPHVPWIQAGTSRWKIIGSATWTLAMLLLAGITLWSFF